MKTSAFAWTACFALALSLGGCFGGNDGDDDTAGPGGRSNLDKLSPGLYLGDYSPYASVSQLDGDLESEFLINAAGYTGKPNVDACELHKHECLFGNAVLPGIVADACAPCTSWRRWPTCPGTTSSAATRATSSA